PTAPPVRTPAPPPPPTSAPQPTPSPTPPPTPTPTPSPSPTPSGPTVIGGFAAPGSLLNVAGHGWSTALITISWEDGRPLGQGRAGGAGDFVFALVVPFDASVGTPHRFTASDGRLSAAGFITAYTPAISVSCT